MRMLQHVGIASAVLVGSLLIGIVGYHALAHMRWVDSFLNAAMILGGMGPVGDLPTDTAKIFAGCYALYAGVVFIAVAGIMIAPVAHRVLHRMHISD
ncbi:MAG: hypothetical protein WCQ64_01290 [Acidobacteriota bacterium]